MREVKFRIRQNKKIIGYEWLENGQWVSYSTDIDVGRDGALLRQRAGTFFPTDAEVSREQYVGIKDKNGHSIYKDDIVKINKRLYYLKWFDDMSFGFDDIRNYNTGLGYTCYSYNEGFPMDKDIEVIGDIYNNPELIKALS